MSVTVMWQPDRVELRATGGELVLTPLEARQLGKLLGTAAAQADDRTEPADRGREQTEPYDGDVKAERYRRQYDDNYYEPDSRA